MNLFNTTRALSNESGLFEFINDDVGDVKWKTEMIIESINLKRNLLKLGHNDNQEDDDDNNDDQHKFNDNDHDSIIKWLCTE